MKPALRCRASVWDRYGGFHAYQCRNRAKPGMTRELWNRTVDEALPVCGVHERVHRTSAYWPSSTYEAPVELEVKR